MKRMLLAAGFALSALFVVVFVSACSIASLSSPAKIAAALCPPTNTAIADYKAFAALYPTLPALQTGNTILTKYQPVVNAVCAEGATVTATTVQDLISQGIPAVAAIVATVPMPISTQTEIQAGFAAAELLVNMAGMFENAVSTAQLAAASGASPTGVVAAAKMSVAKPLQ